jgi:hypothetical protein
MLLGRSLSKADHRYHLGVPRRAGLGTALSGADLHVHRLSIVRLSSMCRKRSYARNEPVVALMFEQSVWFKNENSFQLTPG